ncbi:hypothetical protein L6164_003839 [Bauhinia variegata]|uniref:Uncharacterized protein n=1 Tax=Bauhinia variegata TaxID=167791 RepID=A0ACB9Q589_BAUVA|nr:hypothetical protein L6164_003839 [Bauhinia variegata]
MGHMFSAKDPSVLIVRTVKRVLNLGENLKGLPGGWNENVENASYTVAKAALNAYTKVLAKNFPHFRANSICPGYVKTDINHNTDILSVDDAPENPVSLALLPENGPSGLFFGLDEVVPF